MHHALQAQFTSIAVTPTVPSVFVLQVYTQLQSSKAVSNLCYPVQAFTGDDFLI